MLCGWKRESEERERERIVTLALSKRTGKARQFGEGGFMAIQSKVEVQ